MAYYTLLMRENKTDSWGIAFGDYEKEFVEYELNDLHDNQGYQKQNLRIVTTRTARQSEIDNVLRKLNHESER